MSYVITENTWNSINHKSKLYKDYVNGSSYKVAISIKEKTQKIMQKTPKNVQFLLLKFNKTIKQNVKILNTPSSLLRNSTFRRTETD